MIMYICVLDLEISILSLLLRFSNSILHFVLIVVFFILHFLLSEIFCNVEMQVRFYFLSEISDAHLEYNFLLLC